MTRAAEDAIRRTYATREELVSALMTVRLELEAELDGRRRDVNSVSATIRWSSLDRIADALRAVGESLPATVPAGAHARADVLRRREASR